MNIQNTSKLKGRKLKAIKDFTAADVCFNDGCNPLSFQLGDVFTLLGYRDHHWANVERILDNNNSILFIETFPATERGIVPIDYVVEMDTDEFLRNGDQNGSDRDSLPEGQDDEAMKVLGNSDSLFFPFHHTKNSCEVCQLEK